MKYEVKPTNKFKKDLNSVQKRGYDINLLTEVIKILADGKPLDEKYSDHKFEGEL